MILVIVQYNVGCPSVRRDNPRALASGLSYVQVDKHGITIYTTYISVYLALHEIFLLFDCIIPPENNYNNNR